MGTEALVAYLADPRTEAETVAKIAGNLSYYLSVDPGERTDAYAGAIYNWFIRECVSRNQYLEIPEASYVEIFGLYRSLVGKLRAIAVAGTGDPGASGNGAVARAVREHREALIAAVSRIDGRAGGRTSLFPCAEYSAEFQLAVLGLDPKAAPGPILDIGCGEEASLVAAFRDAGRDAVGIDQYLGRAERGVIRANWLEFQYQPDYWGTVVSHMAFSNHFVRALVSDPELAALYRAAYRDIIDSLRVGGSFRYAPALPREEASLDRSRFAVTRKPNAPGDPNLDTAIVTRLR